MVPGFDVVVIFNSITEEILDIKLPPMIVYTDSKLFYDYLAILRKNSL